MIAWEFVKKCFKNWVADLFSPSLHFVIIFVLDCWLDALTELHFYLVFVFSPLGASSQCSHESEIF